MSTAAQSILAQRDAFKAFLSARTGNAAEAEDILQDSLVKALGRTDSIRDHGRAVAWFYRLLRRAVIDRARSRKASRRRDEAWTRELVALNPDRETRHQICACFEALLPDLPPRQAELLRLVELQGQSVSAAAVALGLTATNASVTLHRARAALRKKLREFCGPCADGACLDCDCAAPKV